MRILRLLGFGVGAAVGVCLLWIIAPSLYRALVWRTVVSESKPILKGGDYNEFSISRPSLGSGYQISFFTWRSTVRREVERASFLRMIDQHWFCANRLVYLRIETREQYDSYSMDEKAAMIFDFRSGAMYMEDKSWRAAIPDDRELTAEEATELVLRVAGDCASVTPSAVAR